MDLNIFNALQSTAVIILMRAQIIPSLVSGSLFLLVPEFCDTTPVVFYGFLLFWDDKISNRTFCDYGNALYLHSMML